MSEENTGNLLLVQLGASAPGYNATLAGAINEALNQGDIEEIYGVRHGLTGLINEELIDLAEESQQVIRGLRYTPGVALGGGKGLPASQQDWERVVDVLQAHNIRYMVLIGGTEALEAASELAGLTERMNYKVSVMVAPVSGGNEIPFTDHSPGYGTLAKEIASLARRVSIEAEADASHDSVTIIEVSGKSSGWVVAASTLARRKNQLEDPPHILLVPEQNFDTERFLMRVQEVLKATDHCLIFTASNLVDIDGNYLTSVPATDPLHQYTSGGTAHVLRGIIELNLGRVSINDFRYSPLESLVALGASETDVKDAELCGATAVQSAVSGETAKMVALLRGEADFYVAETSLVDVEKVIGNTKSLPDAWIGDDGMNLTYQYFKYANPLIQEELEVPYDAGLPKFTALAHVRVDRLLPAHLSA